MAALELALANREVTSQRLHTSHAFHSAMMEPILEAYTERVKRVRLAPPAIPFVSNVTGNWISAEEATDPSYWARHLRHAVQFSSGLERLFEGSYRILLEMGPAPVLGSLAKRHAAKPKDADGPVGVAPSQRQNAVTWSTRYGPSDSSGWTAASLTGPASTPMRSGTV